ncbi:thioredoxin family protein [Bacillus solimangrovi]|uniref:Thiol reductase thioredoxin n=1 Tax=Bacillus solimangrovi TaxID=1305675 RepID=A0A1E5LF93_9BACI|nr:thioredoxin family protein [Bacillus solimangrovi]OEH92726.1 thiol reductase thioredoxin [Bacillus solimangrovi]
MKKIAIIGAIIVGLFIIIGSLTNMANSQKAEGNPYGKADLHPETVKQLKDPNYENLILPDELDEKLNNNEAVTVYFYSPTCGHCKVTTPILKPVADELNVDLKMYNVLEFEQGWNDFEIKGTPTMIHFENGKEAYRISGENDAETFKEWFNQFL